jgi:hypothetical protein
MRFTKEKEEEFFRQHEILEQNSKKIANSKIDQVYIIFPYNQKNLWIPDNNFWLEMTRMMEKKSLLICSPNALVKAKPKLSGDEYLVTINEMVLYYWMEIQGYLKLNLSIQKIIFICTDINIERIRRDFKIVFRHSYGDKKAKAEIVPEYETEEKIKVLSSSVWKKIYQLRERIVFNLPLWLYQFLGSRR